MVNHEHTRYLGKSQALFTNAIWAASGPPSTPVYRRFGLVGVGPYRSLENTYTVAASDDGCKTFFLKLFLNMWLTAWGAGGNLFER